MGLAEALLGKQNPFTQWVSENQGFLGAVGSGLGQGQNIQSGLSAGLSMMPQAKMMDLQAAEKRKAEQMAAQQANATKSWLQANHPDLAQMVDAGMPVSEAWQAAMQRMQPQSVDYPAEFDLYRLTQSDPGFAAYMQGQGGGANAPAGVQEYQFAQMQGYGGTYQDWLREKSAAGRAPMNSTVQKELFEAEDAAKAGEYVISALDRAMMLNDKAYDGPFADVRGDTTALFGDPSGVATAELKNITTETALSQLKTIFGSMPTEGERKILLELQGAVSQPKQVRAAIYKRAKEMAVRRIADNKAKANALRSGEYFDPNYSGQQPGGVDDILKKYGL